VREDEVPQDSENSTYGGGSKLIYARNCQGDYVAVKSAGWDVEAQATRSALTQLRQACQSSWQRACQGETAALEYYMCLRHMDLALLSQTSGLAKWRVKRHLRPATYAKLPPRLVQRYAQALQFDPEQLAQLPKEPLHDSL
jgi:hypothetical protein